MSASGYHPRIHALDELAKITPKDSEEDVVVALIGFLRSIGEVTVASAANKALERIYEQ